MFAAASVGLESVLAEAEKAAAVAVTGSEPAALLRELAATGAGFETAAPAAAGEGRP